MIARAIAAGVPFAWVVGDEVYGSDRRLRLFLEQHEQPILTVRSNEKLWSVLAGRLGQQAAADLAAALPDAAWHRLSAGAGAKGERLYDWARVRLARRQAPPWDHWLLIRRSRGKPEKCASSSTPAETPLAALARVAGRRWTIEECFEAGKQEVGLGDYEIRSWQGWHRHITLALLALAFLVALRAKLNRATAAPDKRGGPDLAFRSLSARLPIRRLIAKLQALTQAALRFILDWSLWRRCHQAIARRCHWKRRATHRRPHHKTQL